MNYFPFDADPYQAAVALDDKRLRRVFTEAVQTLSVLQYVTTRIEGPYSRYTPIPPRLLIWLTADPENTAWFTAWTVALRQVLIERFGKRVLKYVSVIKYAQVRIRLQAGVPRPKTFVNLAKSDVKGLDFTDHYPDTHHAYRRYVSHQWAHTDVHPPIWTQHGPPLWYRNERQFDARIPF